MDTIRDLNPYQKVCLILMAVMPLFFAVVYFVAIHRDGFEYRNTILIPHEEHGSTVYSGKIQGQAVQFTVSEDKSVVFQLGEKTYGPYTAKEDSTAVPKGEELSGSMTGVELCQGESVLFRGGVLKAEDALWLFNENGTANDMDIFSVTGDGFERDENGNIIDPVEPSASTILELMDGPVLTHKGGWLAWFGAVFICVLNVLSILYADKLFRWNLAFQIRNADLAEPSAWEIAGRYINWAGLSVIALLIFIAGLQ